MTPQQQPAGDAPATERVFVYGTLKRGFHNHHVMKRAHGQYRFDAELPGAVMYNLGAYPGIKLGGSTENVVSGELYEVPVDGMRWLDALEGHPRFYIRKQVRVRDADGGAVDAWVYEFPHRVQHDQLIQSGYWGAERGE